MFQKLIIIINNQFLYPKVHQQFNSIFGHQEHIKSVLRSNGVNL